ncbi:hypothetical protein L2E82_49983 [Cichorium intybus]|nr:hypothetical protein L2E82_49983 [Cichorium intybus]
MHLLSRQKVKIRFVLREEIISLQQGLFRSIRTTICESPHSRFQAHLVFLLPHFKPPSLHRQLPLKSSVNLAYLKEYEGEGLLDFDKGRAD